jgi:SnoaL-like domain
MGNAANPERLVDRLRVVEEYLRRFNGHDLDALLDCFGAAAVLVLNGERHGGRDSIRSLLTLLYGDFPDLHLRARQVYLASAAVIAEATLYATPAQRVRALGLVSERRLEIPLCALFHFDSGEKLAESSFYFDGALLLRQMGRLPTAA